MENGFTTFAEIISFAIEREEEAKEFYLELARKAEDPFMKDIFEDFAHEESHHRNRLEKIGEPDGIDRLFRHIADNAEQGRISESLRPVEATPDMDFRQTLIVAMQREDKSRQLYSVLAELTEDDDLSLLFVGLAKEELRHRDRIEKAYRSLYGEICTV